MPPTLRKGTVAIDLQRQTVAVPGPVSPGCTPAYRNALTPTFISECDPVTKAATLYDSFFGAAQRWPERDCLGTRRRLPDGAWTGYEWLSYGDVARRMRLLGSALVRLLDQGAAPHVGLYSINRAEWVIAEGACNAQSLVAVALYDTLGASAAEYIINHAELRVVVASRDKVAQLIRSAPQVLRVIVSMDPLNDEAGTYLREWAAAKNLTLLDMREAEALGAKHPLPDRPPKPNDLATINYTSGTTGDPKGVMLTHRNLASQNVLAYFGHEILPEDTHISYLPLAHIFERSVMAMCLGGGARCGFYRGDVLLLVEDLQCLQPTVFPSVPRLFNRIYAKVRAGTVDAPGVRGALFRRAVATKLAKLHEGGPEPYIHPFWDRLLFSKVQAILGGRIRLMITGSAPLSPDVHQFLRVCFATEMLEGYGQTENSAGATIQMPGEYRAGHVGAPFPSCEIRLVDVPEMNYRVTDKPWPRGEVCIRGANVALGYYKDPQKTKETFKEDGWLHTGDIGVFETTPGVLRIVDRKKAIFKLAHGEYISPEAVENTYTLCPLLQQIYVHGDSLQPECVAIVVPEPEAFLAWCRQRHFAGNDVAALCKDPKVVDAVLEELTQLARSKQLRGFEIAKAIYLEPQPFTMEEDLLTPSFKLRRPQLAEKYRVQIDAMYARLAAVRGNDAAKLAGAAAGAPSKL